MTMSVVAAGAGVAKRYRSTATKTFQCRGYGECRMVFSRSEHLARHIRKHTGERPFSCHCGKQFSRLDNLRQHAQTVHADKSEDNETMMRDLSAVHATMSAKAGTSTRGGRRSMKPRIKDEADDSQPDLRPDTSTGVEGDYGVGNHSFRESPDMDSFRSFGHEQHSFRPIDSFRSNESFRPFTSAGSDGCFRPAVSSRPTTSFGISSSRPNTSSGRPSTSGGSLLPPLSSLVSSVSLQPAESNERSNPNNIHPHSTQRLLPLRRPDSFAGRPDTAPANFFSNAASIGESRLASQLRSLEPPSPPGGGLYGDSPFSFHPPEQSSHPPVSHPATISHGHKRSFGGQDGPGESDPYGDPKSRPQSRRLSVMELLNNDSNTAAQLSRPSTAATAARSSAAAYVPTGAYVPSALCAPATPSSAFRSSTATARLAVQFSERSNVLSESTTTAAIAITTNGGIGIHEEAAPSAVRSPTSSSSSDGSASPPTLRIQRTTTTGKLSALPSVTFTTTSSDSSGADGGGRFTYSVL